jgi:anti-sigma regulatory factor (Ser/Thr protein kinase)
VTTPDTGHSPAAAPQPGAVSEAPAPVLPCHLQGASLEQDWPHRSYLELDAIADAVPSARSHARRLLCDWGLDELTTDAELVLSELVTNGLKASQATGQGSPVRLWLLSDKVRLIIWVWDASPRLPARRAADPAAESGRGLILVDAISDQWSWFAHQDMGGKVVWSELSLSPDPRNPDRPT